MNWSYDTDHPVTVTELIRRKFEKPSTDDFPSYTQLLQPLDFANPTHFEAEKAKARADYYCFKQDLPSEIRWLKASLLLEPNKGNP